jgi:hypothetical protein
VYGFGERKTPKPFVAACDKFIYIENLSFPDLPRFPGDGAVLDAPDAAAAGAPVRRSAVGAAQLKADAELVSLLRNAIEAASDDEGWAPLSSIGNIITSQRPDFDSRNYGYAKLSDLVRATTLFVVERRSPGDGKQAVVYAREKRRQPAAKTPAGRAKQ